MPLGETRAEDRGEYRSLHVGEALVLTPANTDEHPLAELVSGIGEDNGCMQVAALTKHPEEVGDVEVIVGSCDQTAPDLPRVYETQ